MLQLLDFSLFDMTPYSQTSYWDMLAWYHQALWPVQITVIMMILWLIYTVLKPGRYAVHTVLVLLSLAWICNGWIFHRQFYSSINWAAEIFAYLFLLQGCFLLLMTVYSSHINWKPSRYRAVWPARMLLLFALIMYPLIGLLQGRTLNQLELFAITPTPTLIATLALLMLLQGRIKYSLAVFPLVWSIISMGFAWSINLLEVCILVLTIVLWLFSLIEDIIAFRQRRYKSE